MPRIFSGNPARTDSYEPGVHRHHRTGRARLLRGVGPDVAGVPLAAGSLDELVTRVKEAIELWIEVQLS